MLITLLETHLPSSNLPYLFAAFAVSWAVFFVYAFFVTRRQQELQSEIRELRQVLARRESTEGGGGRP
jgi:CcmD family protein